MADQEEKPKMTPEMMKNNQELAAQAAIRAQQMMFRKSIGSTVGIEGSPQASPSKKPMPPIVPARGDSVLSKQPPEIPPKRHSLKKIDDHSNGSSPSKHSAIPPPLPEKPSMARNALKRNDENTIRNGVLNAGAPIAGNTPVHQIKNVAAVAAPPIPPNVSQNPFVNNSPQMARANVNRSVHPSPPKKSISPVDDFSSEDALRGIESGLRNMERAMQEQMNIRSAAQQQQQPKPFGKAPDKMGFNPIRSMERGFSMDQMRLDAMNLGSMRSTLEEMKNKGFVDMNTMSSTTNASNVRPIENHMKSLDRNLPLELQYSRHHHHHRSQSQQEMVDQMRHNFANTAAAGPAAMLNNARQSGAAISREDVRLRRRSSHDENQMSQAQTNVAGKVHSLSNLKFSISHAVVFTEFCSTIGAHFC